MDDFPRDTLLKFRTLSNSVFSQTWHSPSCVRGRGSAQHAEDRLGVLVVHLMSRDERPCSESGKVGTHGVRSAVEDVMFPSRPPLGRQQRVHADLFDVFVASTCAALALVVSSGSVQKNWRGTVALTMESRETWVRSVSVLRCSGHSSSNSHAPTGRSCFSFGMLGLIILFDGDRRHSWLCSGTCSVWPNIGFQGPWT